MSFDITGKLYRKFPMENKSGTFQVREFVIEIMDGNYPQFVKFQLVQDRCQLLDNYEEGAEVKVHFDLRGREWQGKFFTTLNCWRLENPGAATKPAAQAAKTTNNAATNDDGFPTIADAPLTPSGDDDLPF